MIRKPFVAANWKMNKTIQEAIELTKQMLPILQEYPQVEQVLCPPFTALHSVNNLTKDTFIGTGAQNMYWQESGPFTGEISPAMVKEVCQYVILGHSERRSLFLENDEMIAKKIKTAFTHGLITILCIGETLEQNKAGQTAGILKNQLNAALQDLSAETASKMVVAYEPVWAIGTGLPATGEGANTVVQEVIRPCLEKLWGKSISESIRVLYGGSVNAGNVAEFFQQPEIDGALVGGASLKSNEFIQIVQKAAEFSG